ncbi:phage tail terminator family protein [Anaerotruncus rubiinfantis]|uniref:phage tail terminator family protein n=1 Tax=Anaerotruncus rubiinfantis TaxID=1720200 RepID=UPI00082B2C99|nr:hypothetical protein [Anaerotruncus rubiinfantis]
MTLFDINLAVNERIKSAKKGGAFENVPLIDQDVEEPIERPSIKVETGDGNGGKFNGCCLERTVTVRIYFFAKNRQRPKPENTEMRELLENAFMDDLFVGSGAIPIDEVQSVVTDGVLICSFDLYRVELLPDTDDRPLMDTLNIHERVS